MDDVRQRHLVINGWFWGRKTTGTGQYLHGLLPHLLIALSGWRVTLLIPEGRPSGQEGEEIAPIWSESPPFRCRVVKVPMPAWAQRSPRRFKLAWEQLIFPWWCQKLEADVAFVPYWGSPLMFWCPVVVTIHDLIPLLLDGYATKWTARAYTWLVSRSARRADRVLAVSIATARDIITRLRIPLRRIIISYEGLPPGLGPVTDPVELARVRRQYNLPDRYLLYLGGFDPRKNVPLLLKAYAHARTLRPDLPPLVVAGQLPPPGADWFTDPRPLIARWGLSESVRTLGFVPDADKAALYTMADLFLFPSRYEGFGLPPLEAMACGTPALVAKIAGALAEVTDQVVPPVADFRPETWAEAMLELLDRPPDPAALRARAARFRWDEAAAKTAEAIYEAIGEPLPGPGKR